VYKSFNPFKKGARIIKNDTKTLISFLIKEKGAEQLFYNNIPVIKRGKGPYIYDYDENRYVDFYLSEGSLLFGHSPPGLTKKIKSWLGRGYSSGYLVSSLQMLSKKADNLLIKDKDRNRISEGKWLFFDSSSEALLKILPMLQFFGYGRSGIYLTDSPSSAAVPWVNAININNPHTVETADLSNLDYIVIQFKNEIQKTKIKILYDTLEKNKPLIVSDETAFSSYVQVDCNKDLRDKLSMRIFGSWVSAGIPLGFIYINKRFIQNDLGSSSAEDFNSIFLQDSPPLYKVKSALECLKKVEKSGNYNALFERTKHFYKLLSHDIFWLRDGLIFLKENENILKNFNKIRSALLESGLYFPMSPVSPIFLSYTHPEELLIKCARQINLVFDKFYR
jgi:glutamate-1-semialdehyde aminotransferase